MLSQIKEVVIGEMPGWERCKCLSYQRYQLLGCLIVTTIFLLIGLSYGSEPDLGEAKDVLEFANHLFDTKDYPRAISEYRKYLSIIGESSAEVIYRIGLSYFLSNRDSEAISQFQSILDSQADSEIKAKASYMIAYIYFISGEHLSSIKHIEEDKIPIRNHRLRMKLLEASNYLMLRRWSAASELLGSGKWSEYPDLDAKRLALLRCANMGKGIKYKSPTIASLLSAVIPGSGKVYCKQYGDGLYSFFLISLTALIAIDGFKDDGLRSIKGWMAGGASLIFYLGNIYGSGVCAKYRNYAIENKVLKEMPSMYDH